MAAFLSGLFQAELEKAVALAMFMPVVLALAESVAIQSVSIALQRLHGGRPTLAGILRAVRHESLTGILLGAASACGRHAGGPGLARAAAVAVALLGGITGGS